MILRGKIVRIRAIEEQDLSYLKLIINDPEMEKMENGFNFPISSASQKKWYDNYIQSDENNRFIIEDYQGRMVGYTCLLNIDWKNRKAHTGIKLYGNDVTGKGYATDAVMTIMKFAFEELQLNRLESFILDYNTKSFELYIDRCGWHQEGVQREAVFKSNQYHNLLLVSCLRQDYDKLIEQKNYWENNVSI